MRVIRQTAVSGKCGGDNTKLRISMEIKDIEEWNNLLNEVNSGDSISFYL